MHGRGHAELEGFSEEMKGHRELCTAAFAQDWEVFEFVSVEMQGYRELCTAAVVQGWEALELVSEELKGDL